MYDDDPIPLSRRFSWLSPRERTVLIQMSQGYTVPEMAAESFVAVTTVRRQVRGILHKLGVRTQLAAVALLYAALWDSREAQEKAVTAVLDAMDEEEEARMAV